MSAVRVLHVDDEPDIREVVEISLGLDPDFTVRSCPSGRDALATAADWSPDLILLDVVMPGMNGPTILARLREIPSTNTIPVIFMTASTQTRELEQLRALGVDGVIAKPFDPLTLAASVRRHMQTSKDPLAGPRARFVKLARADAITLARDRITLANGANATEGLESIKAVAHRLVGGGGTVGFAEISVKALLLEHAATNALNGTDTMSNVKIALNALVGEIRHVETNCNMRGRF
jgi:two-component system OmpR family response regulator